MDVDIEFVDACNWVTFNFEIICSCAKGYFEIAKWLEDEDSDIIVRADILTLLSGW